MLACAVPPGREGIVPAGEVAAHFAYASGSDVPPTTIAIVTELPARFAFACRSEIGGNRQQRKMS
jgi:hypothetical protein